jgi:hypothetical protein
MNGGRGEGGEMGCMESDAALTVSRVPVVACPVCAVDANRTHEIAESKNVCLPHLV